MTPADFSAPTAFVLMMMLSACGGGEDKSDEDIDITDLGNFGGSEDGASGTAGGDADDGGTASSDTRDDGDGGSADGTGTGSATGGDSDGSGGGVPDDGGGAGSSEPPVPAYAPEMVACADALDFQIRMLDSVGGACFECASGADHWIAATIVNPCDVPMEVTLHDGYIIGGLSLENLSTEEGMAMAVGSTGRVVTETVEPGEWLSEEMWMGTLSDGEYRLSVTFYDEAGTGRDTSFWVN